MIDGPLIRHLKLRVVHAPGMPETFLHHRVLAIPTCITARVCDARAVMHAGIANLRFPLKSVVGKTFPAHVQPTILRIR